MNASMIEKESPFTRCDQTNITVISTKKHNEFFMYFI